MPSIFSNPSVVGFLAGQKKKPQTVISTGLNNQAPGSFTQFSTPVQDVVQERAGSDWIGIQNTGNQQSAPPPPQGSPPPPPPQQNEGEGGSGGPHQDQEDENAQQNEDPHHYITPAEGTDPNDNWYDDPYGGVTNANGDTIDANGNVVETREERERRRDSEGNWYDSEEAADQAAEEAENKGYMNTYLNEIFNNQGDFGAIQSGIDEQRDKALSNLAEMMASRGMGNSGVEGSMAGDVYRGAARDIASSRLEFDQKRKENMAQAAQLLMGDKWKQMDQIQQKQMAEYMVEHEKELFDYIRKAQSGDPGPLKNFWTDFLDTTKTSMPWNWF